MSRSEGQFDFGFDLDDVLFPCAIPLIEILKKEGLVTRDFTIDQMSRSRLCDHFGWSDCREAEYITPEFTTKQDPDQEVLASINMWKHMGARICFITARREPTQIATEEVMYKLGFPASSVFFEHTSKKHTLAQKLGLVLFVDDNPEASLNMARVLPYSFSMPYKYNEYLEQEIRSKKISNLYREDWSDMADLITSKGIHHSVFNTLEKYLETN